MGHPRRNLQQLVLASLVGGVLLGACQPAGTIPQNTAVATPPPEVLERDPDEAQSGPDGADLTLTPPSQGLPGADGAITAAVKDTFSDGCDIAPHCVIIAGSFTRVHTTAADGIARIMPDGAVVPIRSAANDEIYALAMDSSGALYAAGAFTAIGGITAHYIAKWDGSDWSAMGPDGSEGTDLPVNAIAVDASGFVYAGGFFSTAGGNPAHYVAKWDGNSWIPLADPDSDNDGSATEGMDGVVNALGLDESGHLYAAGSLTAAGDATVNHIARWNGTSWNAIGSGVTGDVTALSVSAANDIIVAHVISTGGSTNYRIEKWNGTNWSSLGTSGPDNQVHTIVRDSAGNVYIGGAFLHLDGLAMNRVAKWEQGATSWNSMASGFDGPVRSIFPVANSDMIAAGDFQNVNNSVGGPIQVDYLSRWDGSRWNPTGRSVGGTTFALAISPAGNLVAAGSFKTAGQVRAGRIAKWNGSQWSATGSGMNGDVLALKYDQNGTLFAAGSFTEADGSPANRIARWNGTQWRALGSGLDETVNAIDADESGNLYVGGAFTTAGGQPAASIATWNGSTWTALGNGLEGEVFAIASDHSGNVYAGGNFTQSNTTPLNYIAKWNGSAWTPLGTGLDGVVSAIAVDKLGNLYAGGSFTTAGGIAVNGIAKWNGATWSALSSLAEADPNRGLDGQVLALKLDAYGYVHAAGTFAAADGVVANCYAKWNGAQWSAAGSGTDGTVRSIAIDRWGNPYLAGDFIMAGGSVRPYVAVWIKQLSEWL